MNKYLVVGPPGAGKSTLLSCLPRHGRCTTFDLENVGGKENYSLPLDQRAETRKRINLLEAIEKMDFNCPLFIGCADLDPNTLVERYQVIFLYHPSKDRYLKWVARRNALWDCKEGQAEEENYGHMLKFRERWNPKLEFTPTTFQDRPDDLAIAVWARIDTKHQFRWRTAAK